MVRTKGVRGLGDEFVPYGPTPEQLGISSPADFTGTVSAGNTICCESAIPGTSHLDPATTGCDPNCISTDTGNPIAQLSQQIYNLFNHQQASQNQAQGSSGTLLTILAIGFGALFLMGVLKR